MKPEDYPINTGSFYMNPSAPTTSQDAMKNLQGFQANMQSPEAALQAAQGQLGTQAAQQQVTGLRGAIQNTTNLLNQVAPGVMGRTQDSLVTSGQANRQIQNEQAPIQTNLSKLGTDYNNANQDYTNLENQASARANLALQGQQGQLSYLQSIYNDLSTAEKNAADEVYRQQQAAEAKRQFDVGQANALKSANSGLDLSSLFSGGSTPTDPVAAATGFAKTAKQQLLSAGNVQPFAREAVLNELVSQFGIDPGKAQDIIYKTVFPDNWAGSPSAPKASTPKTTSKPVPLNNAAAALSGAGNVTHNIGGFVF